MTERSETGVVLKLPFNNRAPSWKRKVEIARPKWPKTRRRMDTPAPIVKRNPLYLDDPLLTTVTTGRKRLLVSWNPKFVLKIEMRGVQMGNDNFGDATASDAERSFYESDKVSRSSSEIDEDLFDMSQFPSLPEPKITSHPLSILPERMMRDLSQRLAGSRERNLLAATLAKSERFDCGDCASSAGNSRIDYDSSSMFPIFNQLDSILANSRTIDTFKAKVHSAKERLQRSARYQHSTMLSQIDTETSGKRGGRLKRFYERKRRVIQALIALVLIIVFLSMLITLSICCSNRNNKN